MYALSSESVPAELKVTQSAILDIGSQTPKSYSNSIGYRYSLPHPSVLAGNRWSQLFTQVVESLLRHTQISPKHEFGPFLDIENSYSPPPLIPRVSPHLPSSSFNRSTKDGHYI